MLEFYPMPTNLNHGAALYPHHHQTHHGGARFLDNPNASTAPLATNVQALNMNNNSNNNNNNTNNNNCVQQQQQLTISSAHATCTQHNNLNNNNNNSPISVCASSTASLTAQIISATSAAAQAAAAAAAAVTTATAAAAATNLPTSINSPTSCATLSYASACAPASNARNGNNTCTALPTTPTQQQQTPASTTAAAMPTSTLTLTPTSSSKLSGDCNGRTEVGHIKCEKNYEICEGCGQKIHDRYLMNVGDTNWHEHCLACCYCGMQLHHTCYVRNAKIYCKLDYDRLFGVKCAACCHPILPQEMVMRPIPNFIFHLSCFVCYACRLPLQKGEQFLMRDGQLFCYRHDIEKELFLVAAAQHCGFVGLDEDELMRPRDGRRGPKRPRTILTSQQRKQFKASFDQSPKPCRKVREALAKDTGLSVRVVQVWFQNQRAKMKKIQRKAKNGNGSGSGGSSGNARNGDDKDKEKDEKCIKQESASSSENGYLSLDSAFASQPLNPNLPFSPDDYPGNSNDSFCSSDLSLDGSNFDQLDDDADSLSLNNLELQSTSSSGNHNHHHHHSNPHDMIASLSTSLINPIDKLYLMQNSYFNSEQ